MAISKKFIKSEGRHVYMIDFYDENGKRVRESTGSGSYSFAKELLTRRKDEVAQRKKLPERYLPEIKFSEFVETKYLPLHIQETANERTVRGICKKLTGRFGEYRLNEISPLMIEEYKKELSRNGAANNTVNNYLNTISGIFSKAIDWKFALQNPVKSVKRYRIVARTRILNREEQSVLIGLATTSQAEHLRPLMIFDLNTGLRKGELLTLKWSDIDFENKILTVQGENAKYDKTRRIDLNSHAMAILRELHSKKKSEYVFTGSDGWPMKNFRRSFGTACKTAKIENVTIHDLRRTFGANCVMDGVSLATVQYWMGHQSIETTIKHYGHLLPGYRREEIKKIEGRMDTCMDKPEDSATI